MILEFVGYVRDVVIVSRTTGCWWIHWTVLIL